MTKRQQQQNLSQSRDGGYTIIESLVAMIVVSVLMIAIAPVMAFSVATRVQARRVELASQAATAYINALRVGAIKPPPNSSSATPFPAKDPSLPPAVPPAPTPSDALYCVDLDETQGCAGNKDFLIQGLWRNPANPTNDPTPTGYELTVRVYRSDVFSSSSPNPITTQQQSVANSGLGNPKAPLVVMKTQIPPTTQGTVSPRQALCSQLNSSSNPGGVNTSLCQ
jgi:prepilin-type N-terminal cleavage/methylation domain-containing protein